MKLIECERPVREGYCSDNDCSCGLTPIPRGEGYVYISDEVVAFRTDTLSLEEMRCKVDKLYKKTGEYISICSYAPILVCKEAARKRNLNLTIAAQDAASFWNNATVPLRATPLAQNSSDPQELHSSIPDHPSIVLKKAPSNDVVPQATEILPAGGNTSKALTDGDLPPKHSEERRVETFGQPDINAVKEKSVSVDDVVAQYASGPLAEMAKRMANDLKSNELTASSYVPPDNGTETKITLNTGIKSKDNTHIASRLAEIDLDDNEPVSKTGFTSDSVIQKPLKDSYKKLKRPPRRRNKGKILLFTLIPLLIIIFGSVLFVIFKTLKSDQTVIEPVVKEIPSEPVIEPVLTRDFFEYEYFFEDFRFEGTISFKDTDNTKGIYNLDVGLKGKALRDSVRGTFSFTEQSITFRPDGHTTKIIWNVEELVPDGNRALFFDPLLEDREKARILLTRKL